jgi:hypothetical protein
MEILHGNDASGRRHFDLYHSLADEFHAGLGRLLDDTLVKNGVTYVETRKNIVSSFLFQTMSALDDGVRVKLEDVAFSNYLTLESQISHARDTWYAALAFLRCKPYGVTDDLQGEARSKARSSARTPGCTFTSSQWETAYFKALEGA